MMTFMKILGGYKHLCPPSSTFEGTVPSCPPPQVSAPEGQGLTSLQNTNNTIQKAALVNSTTDILKQSRLRRQTEPGLVALYDIRAGNGAGLPERVRGISMLNSE